MNINDATAQWLAASHGWAAATVSDHTNTSRHWAALGNIDLHDLTEPDVIGCLERVASTAMRKRVRRNLIQMLNWCRRRGMVMGNVAATTDPVRHSVRPVEVFSDVELQTLFGAMEAREAVALRTLYLMAIRPGELWGLHWADWDEEGQTLSIRRTIKEVEGSIHVNPPKTRAGRRTLPLPQSVVRLLQERRLRALTEGRASGDRPIFCGQRSGTYQRASNFGRCWAGIMEKAGVSKRVLYTLRHTRASKMLAAHPLTAVSAWLGHSSPEITLKHYAHLMTGDFESIRNWKEA